MALVKISELPVAVSLTAGGLDELMIIQGGQNKRLAWSTLFSNINSDVVINPLEGSVSFTINGLGTSNLFSVANNKIGIGTALPDALLHVAGDVKVGGVGVAGNLIVSSEAVVVPGSGTMSVNTSVTVSDIVTSASSLSTMSILIGVPNNMQLKVVTYSSAFAGKESGQNFSLAGTSLGLINGLSSIKFAKIGDSVTLLGINGKWSVVGSHGVTFI